MKASKYGLMGASPESVSYQANSRLTFHYTHPVISVYIGLACRLIAALPLGQLL